jgi:hypothetical protein
MLVAMIMLALLGVLATSTLNIAGVDQRIANRNRQHMMAVNTADAGSVHARSRLRYTQPTTEGYNGSGIADTATYIGRNLAETNFGGLNYAHNMGVYYVHATYHRCGNPPPGYSTELGRNGFRSDYWEMESISELTNPALTKINATTATVSSMVRIVMKGACKVR